jgi:NAD dependent epimerase/dehydratase family enzyme
MAFAAGTGIIPGSGNQWLSWIHILDMVDAIRFLIENPKSVGPFNLTAPNPVTMRQMVQTLGRIRKRPVLLHIPSFVLKLMFGKMAGETILSSQDILPEALMDAGYSFHYDHLEDALRNLLNK